MADTNFVDGTSTVPGTPLIAAWHNDVNTATYDRLTAVAGTNTITATGPSSMTAYTAGQNFYLVPANTNTGGVTLNINAFGAKAVTKYGTTPLVAGDMVAGTMYEVSYDGTQFQLINPSTFNTTQSVPAANITGQVAIANGGTGVATLTDLITLVGGATTGDFKLVMRASAPAGWVAGDGGTIGNVGSGATRANVDTLALFTAWWTEYSDAQLPILTSAGGASTRGASAAADWAALKRLTVFDVRGRFPRAAGTINSVTIVNGTKYADTIRDHTHVLNVWNAGSGAGGAPLSSNNTSPAGAQTTSGISGGGGTETAGVSIGMLGCFKL